MRKAAPSLLMTLAIALIATSELHAEIAWQTNLRTAHAQAQSEGKLLLLHFYSDNCSWCDKLEQGAFQEPQVGAAITQAFVPVKVHATKSPKLANMFKVTKFPTDVIVTTDGKTLSHSVSPQSADRYVAMLRTTAAATLGDQQVPATAIAESSGAPATQLANSDPGAENGPVTTSVPNYATATAPQVAMSAPVAQPAASGGTPTDEGSFALPPSNLSTGVTAELAGNRTNTIQMPTIGVAESEETQELTFDPPATTDPLAAANAPDAGGVVADSQLTTSNVSDSMPVQLESQIPSVSHKQPELAMQGFCPVTVIQEDKWVEGKPEFGVIHLGKLYLFTTQEKMQTFLSDPVPFTPVLNEIDAVIFFEERRIVPGKREWGLKDPVYNRMFFFADEASMNHFYNQYERYTKAAIEVMDKAVQDANPGS